jgi:hypothetical protein
MKFRHALRATGGRFGGCLGLSTLCIRCNDACTGTKDNGLLRTHPDMFKPLIFPDYGNQFPDDGRGDQMKAGRTSERCYVHALLNSWRSSGKSAEQRGPALASLLLPPQPLRLSDEMCRPFHARPAVVLSTSTHYCSPHLGALSSPTTLEAYSRCEYASANAANGESSHISVAKPCLASSIFRPQRLPGSDYPRVSGRADPDV